jgi:hypothetical protein
LILWRLQISLRSDLCCSCSAIVSRRWAVMRLSRESV